MGIIFYKLFANLVFWLCFVFILFIDYGYNFVLVLRNVPFSFLMVEYPVTHFPIRHEGWFSCPQYFSVINYAAADIPYTHSYMGVRLFLKRLIERRQSARVGAHPGLLVELN